MEGNSGEKGKDSSENGKVNGQQPNPNHGGGGEEEEEDKEILKRRILGHPLYGLLVETHINCLKVSLGEIAEIDHLNATKQPNSKLQTTKSSTSSDIDLFMEAYCITLSKLKQAMEEPLQETTSFIESMYDQLRELSETDNS